MMYNDSAFTIHLFGFTEDDKYIYILMEFVPYGDMLTYLNLVKRIPESHVKYIIA